MLSNNETTARLICEGLKNLLKTKNLDRIRIKEITDEVGLMRPTFYNYFQDKYEVVEYIFTHEVLEPMRPFLQSGLVKEAFHFMIVAIQKDSEFYRREIMRSSQNSFRDILAGSMHDFLLPIIEEKVPKPKHPFLTAENITEYFSFCTYQMADRITGNSRGSDHGNLRTARFQFSGRSSLQVKTICFLMQFYFTKD